MDSRSARILSRVRALRRPSPDAPAAERQLAHCSLAEARANVERIGQRAADLMARTLRQAAAAPATSTELALLRDKRSTRNAVAMAHAFFGRANLDVRAARRELQQFRPALRRNAALRKRVLETAEEGAWDIAAEDKKDWATPELKRMRAEWRHQGLFEATVTPGASEMLSRMQRSGRGA